MIKLEQINIDNGQNVMIFRNGEIKKIGEFDSSTKQEFGNCSIAKISAQANQLILNIV